MHVLASSCVFFRANKTGLHLSQSTSVDYRPDRRQVSQKHIAFLSFCRFSVPACLLPPPLFFAFALKLVVFIISDH